jgi:hypothetical protein
MLFETSKVIRISLIAIQNRQGNSYFLGCNSNPKEILRALKFEIRALKPQMDI